ncbi:MAG: L-threonylcarbamoyladenylate synthase [Gammaproteobacteria bacterium]|nr:L-threonylcarbamoyladenylate synthase [Gammaproteobacteria bacterium]NNL50712.1 L-threonylcarbamoyladenylate synthase [Woeseiaceae bacterium]
MMFVTRAAEVLLGGGVIAYPTEGVFGLGCLPDDIAAVARLLNIKQRDVAKGLILIASSVDQLDGWVPLSDRQSLPAPEPTRPVTWVVSPGPRVHPLIRGRHAGLAVRLTSNPVAAAICDAVDSPIVSTSANLSGRSTARHRIVLRRQFGARVDYIVPGDCGPASGASEIRNLHSKKVLRPR